MHTDKHAQTDTHRAQNHVYTDKFTQRHRYTRHTQTRTHIEAHKDIQADTYRLTDIQIDPQDMERYKNTQQEHRDIETQTHKYKQTPRHPENTPGIPLPMDTHMDIHSTVKQTNVIDTEVWAYMSHNTC